MSSVKVALCLATAMLVAAAARSEFLVDDFIGDLPAGTPLPHSASVGKPQNVRNRTISVTAPTDVVEIRTSALHFQGQGTASVLSIVYSVGGADEVAGAPTVGLGFRNAVNAIILQTGRTNSFATVSMELVTRGTVGADRVSRTPAPLQVPLGPGQRLAIRLDKLVAVQGGGVDLGDVHEMRFAFAAPGARVPLGAPFISLDRITADWLRAGPTGHKGGGFSANWVNALLFLLVVLLSLTWLRSRGRKKSQETRE